MAHLRSRVTIITPDIQTEIKSPSVISQSSTNNPSFNQRPNIYQSQYQSQYQNQNKPNIETITIPRHTPVFDYTENRKRIKEDEKKHKKIEYLPGEKMLVELDKSLKKEKKKEENDKYVKNLGRSLKKVIGV